MFIIKYNVVLENDKLEMFYLRILLSYTETYRSFYTTSMI